jgi:hypothetical protein
MTRRNVASKRACMRPEDVTTTAGSGAVAEVFTSRLRAVAQLATIDAARSMVARMPQIFTSSGETSVSRTCFPRGVIHSGFVDQRASDGPASNPAGRMRRRWGIHHGAALVRVGSSRGDGRRDCAHEPLRGSFPVHDQAVSLNRGRRSPFPADDVHEWSARVLTLRVAALAGHYVRDLEKPVLSRARLSVKDFALRAKLCDHRRRG